ncbi:MAG: M23 family metallopeptidase [Treponema sp.]|nr:M23 family metallopeptidase [Treponema sp.]
MASVHEYKRLENSIIKKLKNSVVIAGHGIVRALQAIGSFLTRRYTVVFVPHSEKKVYNFQITVVSVFLFLLVTGGIVGAFFWYSASYSSTRSVLAGKDNRLREVQASLEQLRDETASLLQEARNFEEAFNDAFSTLGSGYNTPQSSSGDLGSIINIRETPEGVLQEVDDIKRFSRYLSSAAGSVKEFGAMHSSQSALLSEIPSIWPVKGGTGHISMFFGQNENPFSGQQYIHKGIDISTYRSGDPVVATADGQVVTIEYVSDFGNYILIRHKHGYYTRYAHLLSSRVRVGQRVQQGDVIGYIGNTGLSTGPHLHYEIHIGSDVVDPYRYITIRSNIAKQGR